MSAHLKHRVVHQAAGLLALLLLRVAGLPAAGVQIDRAEVAEAVRLGSSRDASALQAFHRAYRFPIDAQGLDELDVVTEFRRAVLLAEGRARLGDVRWGVDQALGELAPYRQRVAFVLRVNFSPQNTYRTMPAFDMRVYRRGRPDSRPVEPSDLLVTPSFIAGQPAPPGTPLLFGTVEARFDADRVDMDGRNLVGIVREGREIRRVDVDLGALR